ncbi:MAG: amylo-alpha-1,6-glucosidase [Vicinamibacterales bacterium]
MTPLEWLEADGLGGFASGTSTGLRTRRYHGLLLTATTPPTGRMMLVNGLEVWIETSSGRYPLSSQRYAPDVLYPDGVRYIESFTNAPWPCWTFRLDDGTVIEHAVLVEPGSALTVLSWRLRDPRPGMRLQLRPLISGRDYHALHHENAGFAFQAEPSGAVVTWRPYAGVPSIAAITNGTYTQQPEWYRNFLYEAERVRGLDDTEDLASPGTFTFDLADTAVIVLTTGDRADAVAARLAAAGDPANAVVAMVAELHQRERTRRVFPSALARAAESFLVRRGAGKTIVAGYPWFTDWGRDTFIALRGLCVSTGRLADARDILVGWVRVLSEGMLPNRFPDQGDTPEYNSVDASLWYVVAVDAFLSAARTAGFVLSITEETSLRGAVEAIVSGYAAGTRYGIRADADGLLACGEPGVQLTWMDAKIGNWVVTPRTGKPVEIQALWLNALSIAGRWTPQWSDRLQLGLASFRARFWMEEEGRLADVVDVDHVPGTIDASFRPNQILAVGGLPLMLLEQSTALRVVSAIESALVTPMGLRSLAPGSPGYAPHYEGDGAARDARYHQGTVWPWLIGPFVEAWLRVHGSTARTRREARTRFLGPLLALAEQNGGQLPEIADADPPHTLRGCQAQAWSVAEVLRVELGALRGASTHG